MVPKEITDKVVNEALTIMRREGEDHENAAIVAERIPVLCAEAAEAAEECRTKVFRIREEWMR